MVLFFLFYRDIFLGGVLELFIFIKVCVGIIVEINKFEYVVFIISFIYWCCGDVSILLMLLLGMKNEMFFIWYYDDFKEGFDNWGFMIVYCWGKCCL